MRLDCVGKEWFRLLLLLLGFCCLLAAWIGELGDGPWGLRSVEVVCDEQMSPVDRKPGSSSFGRGLRSSQASLRSQKVREQREE